MKEEKSLCVYKNPEDERVNCATCRYSTLVPVSRDIPWDTIVDGVPHRFECCYREEEEKE